MSKGGILMEKAATAVLLVLIMLAGIACVPTVVVFDGNPRTITSGQSATLVWNVTGSNSVNIDPGVGTASPAGSITVSPTSTTTYNLIATGLTGSTARSVTITVNPPPVTANFDVTPTAITVGASAVLQWNVAGATTVRIDPGVGNVPLSGGQNVTPTATTTYTLTASNSASSVTRAVTVIVNPPSIIASFSANPQSINAGQPVTINWNITGASNIVIDPGIGNVPDSGSRTVYPNTTTTYTMTASNSCCTVSRSVTITVNQAPPIADMPLLLLFNINPGTIHVGGTATLQWTVLNATSVFISPAIGPVPASGSITVSPTTTTIYSLTATNGYGTRVYSVGIVVTP
jgi:hypothetical protein